MTGFKEYDLYDGLGLAELIAKKKVSALEVCDAAIARIEKLNPKLNAVVFPMYDNAREAVIRSLADGPFKGVPFLVKDQRIAVAGVPLTEGCRAYKDYIPEYDSELVVRYKKAGLVILGKTNTPEFALLGYTEPELFGPTRNPWNLNHTPGGSSGGSAAAVAAGMVPFASGGDGGGSLRIPASCCGLLGMKVTRGRNPTGPIQGTVWQGAVVEHVISRSVRDSAAILDFTCGGDVGAPYSIPLPQRPYLEEIGYDPGSLSIAFNTRSPIDTEVHPECIQAVRETAALLEKLGHKVEEVSPDIDGITLAKSYLALYMGEVAADIEKIKTVLGRKARRTDVETTTWTLGLLGRTYSAGYFVTAMREWDKAARIMGRFHQKYDIYVTPTIAAPPVKIGELKPRTPEQVLMKIINFFGMGGLLRASKIVDKLAVENLRKTPFTQLANFTGQPAVSLPLSFHTNGLPCGVQFMAGFGEESTLFRLAAQIEKAKPWFDKRPPLDVLNNE